MTIEGYILFYEHDGRFQKIGLAAVPKGDPIAYLKIEAEDVPTFRKGSHATFDGLTEGDPVQGVPYYERLQPTRTVHLKKDDKGDLQKVQEAVPEIKTADFAHKLELAGLVLVLSAVLNKKPSECVDLITNLALTLYTND